MPAVPPSALVVTGILSAQLGAGLAGRMFSQVGPAVMAALRLWTSAALIAAFSARGLARSVRDLVRERAWQDSAVVVAFGVTLGVMNFSIYQSFARIPLGIAVTIEFLGPLAVAVASSRRLIDLLWVALAGAGVALLSNSWSSLSVHHGAPQAAGVAVSGVAFALVAATGWAAYILLSASTGRRFRGSSGLVIAMLVAAIVVTPAAAAGRSAGPGSAAQPGVIGVGIAVGLLSSVIPYRLELEALRRIPARIFGIWMSLEPAVAALAGLVLLGEALAPREWAAIGCVILACAGAARGARAEPRPADPGALPLPPALSAFPAGPAAGGAAH
jgi:inner membrane transporter RhtA